MRVQSYFLPIVVFPWFFLNTDLSLGYIAKGRYIPLQSPLQLLAVVLEVREESTLIQCMILCMLHNQCTGVKISPLETSINCILVSTNFMSLASESSTPFKNESNNFQFYCDNLQPRNALCVQRSPRYAVWGHVAWSTKDDYVANGSLTGIRIWYAVDTLHANCIHGIQLRFGETWTDLKGHAISSFGELQLSKGETIVSVRYWTALSMTPAVEFTTSRGTVYGPWGEVSGEGQKLQMDVLLWISGGTDTRWTEVGTFVVVRPIAFFYSP